MCVPVYTKGVQRVVVASRFFSAVMNSHLEVAQILLAEGVSPYAADSSGITVFHEAAQAGCVEV
jgi:ankyrin repeat protein